MADQAMTPQVGTVPFTESIEHLRRKLDLPSRWWDDYRGEIHAHAFTVAGATKLDLVADLHAAVTAAIEDGETIGDFRKRFDAIVDQHGWAYRGSRGWRTRMIYDTNLRTAHMAGHWQQMQRTKATRPYLLYLTVDDGNVRDEHQRWHYKLLHIDDVWWDAHLPPNDWGCRCWVVSVSEADIKRLGLKISKSPQVTTSLRINSRTGEVYGQVPDGVGVGWDYNVGKAALVGPTNALGRYIIKAFERGDRFAQAAVGQAAVLGFARQVQAGWQRWVAQVQAEPAEAARYHPAGYLDANVLAALAAADALPSSAAVLAGRSTIAKSTPKKKEGRQASHPRPWTPPTCCACRCCWRVPHWCIWSAPPATWCMCWQAARMACPRPSSSWTGCKRASRTTLCAPRAWTTCARFVTESATSWCGDKSKNKAAGRSTGPAYPRPPDGGAEGRRRFPGRLRLERPLYHRRAVRPCERRSAARRCDAAAAMPLKAPEGF